MTIKRKLFLSNLMMIIVPILIAALVGIGCLMMIYHVIEHGSTYFSLDNDTEFYRPPLK